MACQKVAQKNGFINSLLLEANDLYLIKFTNNQSRKFIITNKESHVVALIKLLGIENITVKVKYTDEN